MPIKSSACFSLSPKEVLRDTTPLLSSYVSRWSPCSSVDLAMYHQRMLTCNIMLTGLHADGGVPAKQSFLKSALRGHCACA